MRREALFNQELSLQFQKLPDQIRKISAVMHKLKIFDIFTQIISKVCVIQGEYVVRDGHLIFSIPAQLLQYI